VKIKIYASQILPTSLSYFNQKYKIMIQGFIRVFLGASFSKLKWLSSRVFNFLVKTMGLKDWQCSLFWDFVFKFPLKMKNFNFYPIIFVAIVQNSAKKNIGYH
jgi:hypothetical protein